MKRNYNELLERLKKRSNPLGIENKKAINEGVGIPYSDVNEFIKLAMIGVPQEYTNKSIKAAEMVIEHLKKSHGKEVEFKFQGSVQTNTHILSENDIDLVQITNKSNTIDRVGLDKELNVVDKNSIEYQNLKKHADSFTPYVGNQLSDLGKLRVKSETVLQYAYDGVNITKSKAICVNIKSPLRSVDVVTAVKYKAIPFMKSNQEYKIGIQVYDKDTDSKLPEEFPFWSIKLINEKNLVVGGRLKKMIRFLKNLKFEVGLALNKKIELSSYDINAICFNIKQEEYMFLNYLALVVVLYKEFDKILSNEEYRNSIKSIDGQEFIFLGKGLNKLNQLRLLKDELDDILSDLNSFNNLAG